PATLRTLGLVLAFSSLAHLVLLVLEHLFTPSPTVHHDLAVRAIVRGPYRRLFWVGALGLGGLAPVLVVAWAATLGFSITLLVPAAVAALAGSLAWEYIWIEAGQAVPNS
ncbi:MAG TPA: NrfD/PsrC family molybdoenzyme membrane anchor subunit, partial [Vicinamibacterales bacterium]|nr:NrfD/PsrC family molybdoenzyme membrane anchor subunit [Vicinamibacterales bacterium]